MGEVWLKPLSTVVVGKAVDIVMAVDCAIGDVIVAVVSENGVVALPVVVKLTVFEVVEYVVMLSVVVA